MPKLYTQTEYITKHKKFIGKLREAGFNGTIYFRPPSSFGKPDSYGPAIHRRIAPTNQQYEVDEIMHSVERDNFETVVLYMESK